MAPRIHRHDERYFAALLAPLGVTTSEAQEASPERLKSLAQLVLHSPWMFAYAGEERLAAEGPLLAGWNPGEREFHEQFPDAFKFLRLMVLTHEPAHPAVPELDAAFFSSQPEMMHTPPSGSLILLAPEQKALYLADLRRRGLPAPVVTPATLEADRRRARAHVPVTEAGFAGVH